MFNFVISWQEILLGEYSVYQETSFSIWVGKVVVDLGQGSASADAGVVQIDLDELIRACPYSPQRGSLLILQRLNLLGDFLVDTPLL